MSTLVLPAARPTPWAFVAAGCAVAAIATLPPAAVVTLATALLLAWAAATRPAVALGALAFAVPLQDAILFPLGPTAAPPARLAALAIAAGWGLRWLAGRAHLRPTGTVVAWGLYAGWLALTIVVARDRAAWGAEVWRWGIGLVVLVIATDTLRTPRAARPLLAGGAAGLLVTAIAAGHEVLAGDGPPTHVVRGVLRASAWFGEPNPLAAWVELTAPLLIAVLVAGAGGLRRRDWRGRAWFGLLALAAGAGVATLALTQSRGGAIGFAAAQATCGLAAGGRLRRTTLAVGALAVALVLGTAAGRGAATTLLGDLAPGGGGRDVTSASWSVDERLAHWRAGIAMATDHPVMGIGAGNFDAHSRAATRAWRFRIPRGHAHNGWIQAAAQGGAVGLVAFSAILLCAGLRAWRGLRATDDREARALAIGSLAVVMAVAGHGLFDHMHGLALNLTIALALACAEPALARHPRGAASPATFP
jgi:O-antigen ligase